MSNTRFGKRLCGLCGKRFHPESHCPARNWSCYACGKKGHTSTVCAQTQQRRINMIKMMSDYVNTDTNPHELEVNLEGHTVMMEIDSGACASVVDQLFFYKFLSHVQLCHCNNSFLVLTGESIQVLGYASVGVTVGGVKRELILYIVKSNQSFKPLMGRNWINVLWPTWRNFFSITSNNQVNTMSNNILVEISSKFPNIVQENNDSIKNFSADIVLEENSTPIFHKSYSLPYKSREVVEKELDRLVESKILEPVKYSKWASPIVAVPKSNGSMRICIDCKVTVNKFVCTEHYPLPRIDDIFASLSNCKYYCVVDLTGAYKQVIVSEKSREYLTINTHKGLFRYTRLPFGLKSAPSIFQNIMDQILSGLPKVCCYLDDILIGGSTKQQCQENLYNVLGRLNEFNVKINLNKCIFLEQKVDYLGHTLTPEGIRPNKSKVEAIEKASRPQNLQQLQSYLGLLNYYSRFIPNLASRLKVLYDLLRKDKDFEWSSACQSAFLESKLLLKNHNLLEINDLREKVKTNVKINKKSNNKNYFKKGEKVMFMNQFKNSVNWVPARVLEQISEYTYLINVHNKVRFVHVNALKKSTLNESYHPPIKIITDKTKLFYNSKSFDCQSDQLSQESDQLSFSSQDSPGQLSFSSQNSPGPEIKTKPTFVKSEDSSSPHPPKKHKRRFELMTSPEGSPDCKKFVASKLRRSKRIKSVPDRFKYPRDN